MSSKLELSKEVRGWVLVAVAIAGVTTGVAVRPPLRASEILRTPDALDYARDRAERRADAKFGTPVQNRILERLDEIEALIQKEEEGDK